MENRRQSYRHAFVPEEALRVELHKPGQPVPFICELLDLSVGGMRVRLNATAHSLRTGDSVITRLFGRDTPEPVELSLALPSRIVHVEQQGDNFACGIHFLPTANPSTNESIERTLGRFLMGEQRRLRQSRKEGERPA
jgi:c-di-GMP-binding flagellar brake protein YcgR